MFWQNNHTNKQKINTLLAGYKTLKNGLSICQMISSANFLKNLSGSYGIIVNVSNNNTFVFWICWIAWSFIYCGRHLSALSCKYPAFTWMQWHYITRDQLKYDLSISWHQSWVDKPKVIPHLRATVSPQCIRDLRVLLRKCETLCSRPRCAENKDNLDRYQADDAARPFAYRHFPLKILVTGFRCVDEKLRTVSGAYSSLKENVQLSFLTASYRCLLSSGRGGGRHRPWRHRGRWEMH